MVVLKPGGKKRTISLGLLLSLGLNECFLLLYSEGQVDTESTIVGWPLIFYKLVSFSAAVKSKTRPKPELHLKALLHWVFGLSQNGLTFRETYLVSATSCVAAFCDFSVCVCVCVASQTDSL